MKSGIGLGCFIYKVRYKMCLLILLITTGVIVYMANERGLLGWNKYASRPPRILRLELAAPYDQIVDSSGLDTFVKMTYESNDRLAGFSMSPWQEPSKSAVIMRYGFPEPIFELPPSTFVLVSFEAAHMFEFTVKPMITPLHRTETIELATSLIKTLDSALTRVLENTLTLEEVWLRMQLLSKYMDKDSFKIGRWKRDEVHGSVDFVLYIKVLPNTGVTDVAKQLYSISFFAADLSGKLDKKLEVLRLVARKKVRLTEGKKPCTQDSFDCDIPDVRIYLDTLRKENLIPIKND